MPRHIKEPFVVPIPGGKVIEEFIGRANSQTSGLSVAHMIAPPGWEEPAQCPDFDEVTIVLRGKLRVDCLGVSYDVCAGETILCEKGERIRYSNPFSEESEIWAICTPAFNVDLVHRDEE